VQSKKGRVLLVDDDADIRLTLGDRIGSEGYKVLEADSGEKGLDRIRADRPEVVLLDLQMPGMGGLEVLARIREEQLSVTVVVVTAYGNVQRAVEAMRAGAFDFVPKPIDAERISVVVAKALEHERLRRDNAYLRAAAQTAAEKVIGQSLAMCQVLELARRAAISKTTLLLTGESGTGKGLLARSIHQWSERSTQPFVAVNCVALHDQLLESELFGHEKGAFTGAQAQHSGRFEAAHGGTLFLDEIGSTKPDLQLKLLQVLQEGIIQRVGSNEPIEVDVRVIAATNRDLPALVEQGLFLEDLYYRLNVISLSIVPLRQRREDIPALAEHFLQKFIADAKRPISAIGEEAMHCLCQYDWPGNVRELENAIERAVVLGVEEEIGPGDLPDQILSAQQVATEGVKVGYHAALEDYKRQLMRNALAQTGGNQSQAAELLGVHRTYLARMMKTLKLR
jgi:DNA-binding NtrC family response regulator